MRVVGHHTQRSGQWLAYQYIVDGYCTPPIQPQNNEYVPVSSLCFSYLLHITSSRSHYPASQVPSPNTPSCNQALSLLLIIKQSVPAYKRAQKAGSSNHASTTTMSTLYCQPISRPTACRQRKLHSSPLDVLVILLAYALSAPQWLRA